MERDAFDDFLKWKDSEIRKPLILRGARQVGKTWLVRRLGEVFDHFLEVNLEERPQVSRLFDIDLNPHRIISELGAFLGEEVVPGKTLLFIDEIQTEPKAIAALRYLFEKIPELHVIAAGSLLEFELDSVSFPVGRVEFYYLYPMSFGEFLNAIGRASLRKMIRAEESLSSPFHEQHRDLFRDYTILGGMPAVLNAYIRDRNIEACRKIQTTIIETFLADFPKYAGKYQIKYLHTVFSNVVIQLGRKFKYSNVSTLYRSRELQGALELLEKASLLQRVYHSSANGIPLYSERDDRRFKVVFFDTGLALNLLRVPLKEFYGDYDISLVNEGAIAEQVVGQELIAGSDRDRKPELYYWHREAKSSNAVVDYLLVRKSDVVPVEVRRGIKGRIRSLQIFMNEKGSAAGIVISNTASAWDGNVQYIPFYAIEKLFTQ